MIGSTRATETFSSPFTDPGSPGPKLPRRRTRGWRVLAMVQAWIGAVAPYADKDVACWQNAK